jgi:hypothetical protein
VFKTRDRNVAIQFQAGVRAIDIFSCPILLQSQLSSDNCHCASRHSNSTSQSDERSNLPDFPQITSI